MASTTRFFTNRDSYFNRTFIPLKSGRINLKYLTALFNSKLVAFWLRHKGKMQGDNYQIDKAPILSIPIKKIDNVDIFVTLLDKIMAVAKGGEHLRDSQKKLEFLELETEIDARVAHLYNLTEEEYAIILKDGEDDFRVKAQNFHKRFNKRFD